MPSMPSHPVSLHENIRLHGVATESIVDGPGLRYALFVQGCTHNCLGCHNPQSHCLTGGYEKSILSIFNEILENPILSGVTFSGGEPFLQARALCTLGRLLQQKHIHIVTFTGYTLEQLGQLAINDSAIAELLTLSNMLIDGPFVKHLQDENLRFCGSSNQRIWSQINGKWELDAKYTQKAMNCKTA